MSEKDRLFFNMLRNSNLYSLEEEGEMDSDSEEESEETFKNGARFRGEMKKEFSGTLLAIVFGPKVPSSTVEWIVEMIRRRRSDGGAELQVRTTPKRGAKGVMLHISASIGRLLETAELMEIKKVDRDGLLREFTLKDIPLFLHKDMHAEDILHTAEKQRVVYHELLNLRTEHEMKLQGCEYVILFPGQSILQVCENHGIITNMFPLHDQQELAKCNLSWHDLLMKTESVDEIRTYFGDDVAYYFAFLGHYTYALLPPAVFGVIQYCMRSDFMHTQAFFAVFNLIWVTVFLELWKRRSNELAFKWGTLGTMTRKELRPTYHGEKIGIDPVTGQHVPIYPKHKRYLKLYLVSLPIVMVSIVCSFLVMLVYLRAEWWVLEVVPDDKSLESWISRQTPGVLYALVIVVMNSFFRKWASSLTEWENHKTKVAHQNHWLFKTVMFEFLNNNLCIFYIAFYLQDMEMLKWQVALMLIAYQLWNHFQEALLPALLSHSSVRQWSSSSSSKRKEDPSTPPLDKRGDDPYGQEISFNEPPEKMAQQAWEEETLYSRCEGTFDDYLEIFTQFAYVFLFSSVYPLAALMAFLNNVLEIRADLFKFCTVIQRPIPLPANGIGAWQAAFEVLGDLAVITNCALLALSPTVRSLVPNLSTSEWILLVVVIEHIILAIKYLLVFLIPDMPEKVNVAMQKSLYEAGLALKRERITKTKRVLRRLESAVFSTTTSVPSSVPTKRTK